MPFAIEPGLHPGQPPAIGLLALGAVLVAAVVAVTHQRGRAWSASLLYVAVGLGAAAVLDAMEITWVDPVGSPDAMVRLTEIAVVVAVFANGIRIDRELKIRRWRPTVRLLAITMPLSVAAAAGLGVGLLGLSLGAAIVLGAALSPTDPVLAGDVGETQPGNEEPEAEFAITSEASLNDGLAAPFIVLGLLVAGDDLPGSWGSWLGIDLVLRCAIGVAAGAVVGRLAGRAVPRLREREWLHTGYDAIFICGLALATFGAGEVLGGYGFLSAFAGGVAFRRCEREHETHAAAHHGAERLERLFELLVLLLATSSATSALLDVPGAEGWLLAALTIVVVRPVLGWLSLAGVRETRGADRLYVSWFGVRGIGTLFYASAVVASGVLAKDEAAVVWWTALATVLVSIGVHGLTSGPATRAMAARRDAAA
ncbi:MAG TPA: cation:proton antiporter [Baekduia sp.]|nr:cation:proton antiporter [Baekduia sp.]